MKTLLLTTVLFFCVSLFAQESGKNYLSLREFENLKNEEVLNYFSDNKLDDFYNDFYHACKVRNIGTTLCWAGSTTAAISFGLIIINGALIASNTLDYIFLPPQLLISTTIAGGIATIISIPIICTGNYKMAHTKNAFIQKHYKNTAPALSLSFQYSANGFGLALNF